MRRGSYQFRLLALLPFTSLVAACGSQVQEPGSEAASSGPGTGASTGVASSSAGTAAGATGSGGGSTCPATTDACTGCMANVVACAPLEECVADPICAPAWQAFVACETSGKSFSTCIGELTNGGQAAEDLVLQGANACGGPCAGSDNPCAAQPSGGACAACCKTAHPDGFNTFILAAYECGCSDCTGDCSMGVCQSNQPPPDACIGCVQTSLLGPCNDDAIYQQSCLGNEACAAYADCLLGCPSG